MQEIIELAFSGVSTYIGFYLIIYLVLRFVYGMWARGLRHLSIWKHGWPPSHLDADGDWLVAEDDEQEHGEIC